MILAFDTETTGLPLWHDPSDDPRQPHIVQLAAILFQPNGEEVETFSTIVNPGPGIVSCPESLAAHGITPERCAAEGIPPREAVAKFMSMYDRATEMVGHNVTFDFRMMRIAHARTHGEKWRSELPYTCTMRSTTNIVNLPPTEAMLRAGRRHPKSPNLGEAYAFFFGETLEGAHDALVDVRASARIYFHLKAMRNAA